MSCEIEYKSTERSGWKVGINRNGRLQKAVLIDYVSFGLLFENWHCHIQ